MLIDPEDIANKADFLIWQPDQAGRRRVTANKNQFHFTRAADEFGTIRKREIGRYDDDVIELSLDLRLALKAIAHTVFEILGIPRHLFVRALVSDHGNWHKVLVAQRVAAMMIGIDHI